MSLKDGSYKNSPVKIDAVIKYPEKGDGPYPIVVFNHSSGGPILFSNKWFKFNRQQARYFLKKGIAVMFVDNFSSRNAMNVGADQSQVSTFSFYIDAFMTLDFLSNGFKLVGTNADEGTNQNGQSFIYLAFAESPFKNSRAR